MCETDTALCENRTIAQEACTKVGFYFFLDVSHVPPVSASPKLRMSELFEISCGWHHQLYRLLHSKHDHWYHLHDGTCYMEHHDVCYECMLRSSKRDSRIHCCIAVHV